MREWRTEGIRKVDGDPFLVDVRIDDHLFSQALVDSRCLCYATIVVSENYASQLELPRIAIKRRILDGVLADMGKITQFTYGSINIHGHQ